MCGQVYRMARLGLLALGVGMMVPACIHVGSMPPHPDVDKAEARRVPSYFYYPGPCFYLNPLHLDYYWRAGKDWRAGQALPPLDPEEPRESVAPHSDAARPADLQNQSEKGARDNKDIKMPRTIQGQRVDRDPAAAMPTPEGITPLEGDER